MLMKRDETMQNMNYYYDFSGQKFEYPLSLSINQFDRQVFSRQSSLEISYVLKGNYEVIPTMSENAYDEIYKLVGNSIKLAYAKGYNDSNQVIDDDDILLTHDITNSSVDSDAIKMVIEAAKQYGAATNGTEQVQTLFSKDEDNTITGTVPKCSVASGYTPEAYRMELIKSCFDTKKRPSGHISEDPRPFNGREESHVS